MLIPVQADPELLSKVRNLELRARLVVEGFMAGLHKSPYHGYSAEFSQHRQYRPGDELKHVDWKIYARTNRYHIKQFEEETNMRCVVVVDTSSSMAYASEGNPTKFDYAVTLAAAFAYMIIKQRDAAGVATFDTEVRSFHPPRSKPSYIAQLLTTLAQTQPAQGTSTATALHDVANRLVRRGMVILLSDLFDDPGNTLKALRHFRHDNHDVIVVHVLDPRELDFQLGRAAVFQDMEDGSEITTHPVFLKNSYRAAMESFCNDIRVGCHAQNIDYLQIQTNQPFDVPLKEYLIKRHRR